MMNSEAIGRPIVEKAILLFSQDNHAYLLAYFPELRVFREQQNFQV